MSSEVVWPVRESKRPERAVEVEQDHFVGDAVGVGLGRIAERLERRNDRLMLAEVGEHARVRRRRHRWRGPESALAQFGDSLAGESRGVEDGKPCSSFDTRSE